jgi:uncharacterized protein YraI
MKRLLQLYLLAILLSACSAPQSIPVPTISATSTLLPASTPKPTLAITLDACVTNETIRIREGPGTEYGVTGGLVSGTCITILGRNHDSSWVYIVTSNNLTGWVASWLLTVEGNIANVPVKSDETLSNSELQSAAQTALAQQKPAISATDTLRPFPQSVLLCSQTRDSVGEVVSCKIERAYCDYRLDVSGSPTFCNDRPYPNHNFTLVVFGEDWSDYDGLCIIVRGSISLFEGVPQILGVSRSQVSYC